MVNKMQKPIRTVTNLEAEEETLRRGTVGGGTVGEVGEATEEGGEAAGGEATGGITWIKM